MFACPRDTSHVIYEYNIMCALNFAGFNVRSVVCKNLDFNDTHKRLASLIASKHTASYSATMRMIRCKISFSLIDSAVMCLRGA